MYTGLALENGETLYRCPTGDLRVHLSGLVVLSEIFTSKVRWQTRI